MKDKYKTVKLKESLYKRLTKFKCWEYGTSMNDIIDLLLTYYEKGRKERKERKKEKQDDVF